MIYSVCKICGEDATDFLQQFELLKCRKCGFIFYKKMLDDQDVIELYDKLYNVQDDYNIYQQQANILKRGEQPHLGYNKKKVLKTLLLKKCKKIAEIGAGVGTVGYYLQGKRKEYTGIELDKEAATQAQNVGINVLHSSFEKLQDIKSHDAVIAFEVIEHINDLKRCLELMNQSLAPNGYLGITVPNLDIYYSQNKEQRQNRLGQVGPPVHVNFFTIESLKNILPLFGFRPIILKARPFPYLIWKKRKTYKELWQAIKGNFVGSTLICVAQKVN